MQMSRHASDASGQHNRSLHHADSDDLASVGGISDSDHSIHHINGADSSDDSEMMRRKTTRPAIDDDALNDAWNLARVAMGSLAGEPWRVKQALMWPTGAFELCELDEDSSYWDEFRSSQTYDVFRESAPFRPGTSNGTIDMVIIGDEQALHNKVFFEPVLAHLRAFLGFEVILRAAPLKLDAWVRPRKGTEGNEQVGAHFILAQLEAGLDPRSVCTIGITTADLYPPKTYDYVTGITDPSHRIGIFSIARYFHKPHAMTDTELKEVLTICIIKALCRESLKLCGVGECRLVKCLMNPFPPAHPESVKALPFSLCCICLRKLHWITQMDLLDRYAGLPAVLSNWFMDETLWIWERMQQLGMPTYASLRERNVLRIKAKA